jgi:hypothetical protein
VISGTGLTWMPECRGELAEKLTMPDKHFSGIPAIFEAVQD